MVTFITKHKLLFLHVSFWVLFISYRLFDYTRHFPLERATLYIGVPLFFNIIISYLHYFFILPILIEKKNLPKYIALLIVTLALITSLRFMADNQFLAPLSPDSDYYKTIHFARVVSVLWDAMSFLIFTGMIKFTADWFYLENRRKQLENEKLHAELNYLKSQINPHFLFNTLHNLNYLTLQKKSEASDVIIRLSNIMRYMIYDTKKSTVPIKKELQYMKDYIELERIRLNKAFELTFNIQESSENIQIAPLLLITFLENAFKHGVSDRDIGCWIAVVLTYSNQSIHYSVSNSRIGSLVGTERSGFGLANLKKRLDLHYPDNYDLTTQESENDFKIDLNINLNEN